MEKRLGTFQLLVMGRMVWIAVERDRVLGSNPAWGCGTPASCQVRRRRVLLSGFFGLASIMARTFRLIDDVVLFVAAFERSSLSLFAFSPTLVSRIANYTCTLCRLHYGNPPGRRQSDTVLRGADSYLLERAEMKT